MHSRENWRKKSCVHDAVLEKTKTLFVEVQQGGETMERQQRGRVRVALTHPHTFHLCVIEHVHQ